MTAAEYLEARGWTKDDERWNDPLHYGAWPALEDSSASLATVDALTIQRARDAAEERAAWDRYAAARLSMACNDGASSARGYTLGAYDPADAAVDADKMLEMRRAKFAVEVTP